MCLAQGHNAATPVSLKLADSQFRVKYYTTEPLHNVIALNKVWTLFKFARKSLYAINKVTDQPVLSDQHLVIFVPG